MVCDMGIISCSWLVAIAITSFHIEDHASRCFMKQPNKRGPIVGRKRQRGRRGEHGRKRQKKKEVILWFLANQRRQSGGYTHYCGEGGVVKGGWSRRKFEGESA